MPESRLKKMVIVTEKDWIPGKDKPEEDYTPILATDGKELFEAEIVIGNQRYPPYEVERIWRKTSERQRLEFNPQHVTYYLPTEMSQRILQTIPKK